MMEGSIRNLGIPALLAVLMIGVISISGCVSSNTTNTNSNTQNTSSVNNNGVASGLPVYPGSQESSQYSMWATLTGFSGQYTSVHQYTVSGASPTDVVNWYKSQFADYTVENNGNASVHGVSYALLALQKGNKMVGVLAFEQDGKTVYFVGKTTAPEGEGASLPNHDMANGEEPLTRYHGSVMLSYSKEGKFPINYDIEYGTSDAYDEVGNWFKSTLQFQGWNITSQSGSSDTIELSAEKNDDEVSIYIGAPTDTAYTTIDISYTRRSLPDHDLVNGTDPMERYPNAVMIDYSTSTMSMQGTNANEAKAEYLAPDNFDTVKQWYLNKLNAMFGSGGEPSGVYDYGESIDAGGSYDNSIVQVHIDFERGEEYTDVYIDYTTTETG